MDSKLFIRLLKSLCCLCPLLLSSAAKSEILHVPGEYAAIRDALSASGEGDTVLVAEGSYAEHIIMPGGMRTLAGSFLMTGDTSSIQETILLPDSTVSPDSQSSVSILDAACRAELIGFTFKSGCGTLYSVDPRPYGGAVLQLDGELTIRHCMFRDNGAFIGSAVFSDTGFTRLYIEDCDFGYNTVYQGTVAAYGTEFDARRSRFHHNIATKAAALYVRYPSLVLDSCTIDSNRNGFTYTAAVNAGACLPAVISHCVFRANYIDTTTSHPSTVCLELVETPAVIAQCLFEDNIGIATPALTAFDCDFQVEDCIFRCNRTTQWGAVISLVQNCLAEFRNCLFENNRAFRCPGIAVVDRANLEHCHFVGNMADRPDTCGVLTNVLPTSEIVANNCVFEGNRPYAVYDCYLPTPDFDVRNCWWGDPTGPYHPVRNPQGLGDAICGDSLLFDPWLLEPPSSTDDPHSPFFPSEFSFGNIYPNPFNARVTIELSVTRTLPVRLEIFDLLGRRAAILLDEVRDMGVHSVTWNAGDQPSGIYFARLSSPDTRQTVQVKKLVLLK